MFSNNTSHSMNFATSRDFPGLFAFYACGSSFAQKPRFCARLLNLFVRSAQSKLHLRKLLLAQVHAFVRLLPYRLNNFAQDKQ